MNTEIYCCAFCNKRIKKAHYFDKICWARLPYELQESLTAVYEPGQLDSGMISGDFTAALTACIDWLTEHKLSKLRND